MGIDSRDEKNVNVSIFVRWGDDLLKKRAKATRYGCALNLNKAQAIWHCFSAKVNLLIDTKPIPFFILLVSHLSFQPN